MFDTHRQETLTILEVKAVGSRTRVKWRSGFSTEPHMLVMDIIKP
jgi:hypothetical protein